MFGLAAECKRLLGVVIGILGHFGPVGDRRWLWGGIGRALAVRGRRSKGGDVRVPTTASTVLAWAESRVRMSAEEELQFGPQTDDELARSRYGSSARQLRRLRKAVLSGALRQQADRVGVALPQGFVEVPQAQAIPAPQRDAPMTVR